MSETKLFVGPRVRRIRTGLALTQTAMAQELGVSPSYLNLIERNQRPLTAQLVLKLVSRFKIDPEELQPTGEAGSVAALREVFADPLLSGELPGPEELLELSDGAPNAAIAVVKLYRAFREQQQRLSDLSRLLGEEGKALDASQSQQMPVDAVRAVFEATPWCFPALEQAADRINKALGDDRSRMGAIHTLLRNTYGISVQVLPVETMPVWRKRFDRHSGRLFVSERLRRSDRAELLAQEIVLRQEESVLDEEVELLGIQGDEARRLARMELARYTALAVLMPYERMLRTAERVHYDPQLLANRFDVGFGQAVERLVSLQDKSAGRRAGLPFFSMEIDQGGNILRRIGAKGFPSSHFGGQCPKLSVHAAFARPSELVAERVLTPEGRVYAVLARTVEGAIEGVGDRPRRTAILLGIEDKVAAARISASAGEPETSPGRRPPIEISDASALVPDIFARLLPDIHANTVVNIGPACRLCERPDCVARSAPPLTKPLGLDDLAQGFGAYGLT
ncbi:MAG: short-chain fatty acyl-CoA regulator family protein [Pseudomonadota bacterium]